MSKPSLGLALTLPVVLLALLSAPWASAADRAADAREPHKLGDHPAIVVQRLQKTAGYDYASKFYPHPAMLYLYAEAPRPMMDHPAVIIAKRLQQEHEEQEQRTAQATHTMAAQR